MSEQATTPEQVKNYVIPIVGTFPGADPTFIETFVSDDAQALVLESNGHASPASNITTTIKKITDRGIPVFVLADVYGNNHGITHIADEPQQAALDAGAFFLETIGRESPNADDDNQRSLESVVDAIKAGVDLGLEGDKLGEYVQDLFSYPEGEKPARPDPVQQLRAQHEMLLAEGLGGLTVGQLESLEAAEESRK